MSHTSGWTPPTRADANDFVMRHSSSAWSALAALVATESGHGVG